MSKQNELQSDKVYDYSYEDIIRVMGMLEEDTKNVILSNYKLSEILYFMNHENDFFKLFDNLREIQSRLLKLSNGLAQIKANLNNGAEKVTDEELVTSIVENYGVISDEQKSVVREQLGLLRQEDLPEEKHITMNDILNLYENLSLNEKVRLDSELKKRDTLEVSFGKFGNALAESLEKFIGES